MNTRLRLATALACLSSGAVILAQDAQRPVVPVADPTAQVPTFKSQVEYVEVDVLVTDAEGRPVPGLTKNDFQVFEDGKPQNITSFEFVNIPVERPDRPLFQPNALEPDTSSNERPFSARRIEWQHSVLTSKRQYRPQPVTRLLGGKQSATG